MVDRVGWVIEVVGHPLLSFAMNRWQPHDIARSATAAFAQIQAVAETLALPSDNVTNAVRFVREVRSS
jgi:hypothetical protein